MPAPTPASTPLAYTSGSVPKWRTGVGVRLGLILGMSEEEGGRNEDQTRRQGSQHLGRPTRHEGAGERIWERIQVRHEAFSGNAYSMAEGGSHRSVNYMDGVTVCTTTQRYCKHGEKGYTIKVRGCPMYRNMMLAGINTEASEMDLLPKEG